MAAALSGTVSGADAVPAAEALLQQRPEVGFANLEEINSILTGTEIDGLSGNRIGLDVTSVFVEVVTEVGPAQRIRSYRFDGLGVDDTPQLTYRGWGRETFRPEIETQTDTDSETEVDAP